MRTRSQQQSPSNFVSLESTSRRTRSTRSASQNKTANTTTTDRTDPDPTQEPSGPSGPSKQPPPRAKSQRVTNKKTTTTTKKKVTKAAASKAPAKATRKSTRKTTKATSEEPETHEDETPETTPEADENKENLDDARRRTPPKVSRLPPRTASSPQSPWPKDALNFPHTPAPTAPFTPHASYPTISDYIPVGTIGASWTEFSFEDISDIGSPLSEQSRTPSLDEPLFADGEIDEFLLEQIRGALLAHDSEQEGRGAGQYVHSTGDSAWEQPEAPSTFESPAVAEPTAADSMESVTVEDRDQGISQQPGADSLSTSAVGSGDETVAVSEQVDNLTQHLAKLSLAEFVPQPATVFYPGLPDSPTWQPETVRPARDPTSVSLTVGGGSSDLASQATVSVAPVDPRGPSIFDEPPPPFELPCIGECARRQAQQTPSLISLASPRSRTYDPSFSWARVRGERGVLVPKALAEGRRRRRPRIRPVAAGEPGKPSHTMSMPVRSSTSALGSRPRVPVTLSPIPERSESEMSPGTGRSKVGAGTEVAAGASAPSAASQAPMVPQQTSRCLDAPDRPRVGKKLTHKKVNRKRARSVLSDEETAAGPETPTANKRRNLGAPGSTPFARRLPPLSRRLSSTSVPYSERLRRRQAERNGRIHRTVFRLPEYIAQEMADRQAAETAGQQSPCPEPPLAHVDAPEEPEQARDQDQPVEDAPAQPTPGLPSAQSTLSSALPETPRRGWNIRGLLNSVPRSFSRLIPGFSRSSAQTGQTEQSLPSSTPETTKQPASERIDRTVDSEPEFTAAKARFRGWKPRRRLTTDQPPQKRPAPDYSLFPPPFDRSLYLGDIATPLKDLPDPSTLHSSSLQSSADARPHEQITTANPPTATSESTAQVEDASSASQTQETRGRETPQQASSKKEKKRKREPSPDVIPNPPGCSYGMDTDYFWYSSESEDESDSEKPEPSTAPQQDDGLARTAVRSALRSDRPASKKVRFDASPEDTPSKLRTRARATDPYTGSHFIGMGSGSPTSSSAPQSPTPTASAPASIVQEDLHAPSPVVDPRSRPGFIPNTQGTFQLDYDAFSDDSSESSEPSSPTSAPASTPAPAAETQANESIRSPGPSSAPSATPTPRSTSVIPPSTPAVTVDDEALAKARSLAEKHKPKTPSRLRTASRYSSPLTITPEARVESAPVEDFGGDDEFARDAQWLYENCPSGDLTQFKWPASQSYQESLNISQTAIDVLAQVWNDSEVDEAYNIFSQGFEEFNQQA